MLSHDAAATAPRWALNPDRFPSCLYVLNFGTYNIGRLKLSQAAVPYLTRFKAATGAWACWMVCVGTDLHILCSDGTLWRWSIPERRATRTTTVYSGSIGSGTRLVYDGAGYVFFTRGFTMYRVTLATGLVDRTYSLYASPGTTVCFDTDFIYVPSPFVTEKFRRDTGAFVLRKINYAATDAVVRASLCYRGSLFYAGYETNSVYVLDLTTLETTTTIAVGQQPVSLAEDANGILWCVNATDGTVTLLDGTSVVQTLAVGSSPSFALFDGRKRMYVATRPENSIGRGCHRYHIDTFQKEQFIPAPIFYPDMLVWDGVVNPEDG